MRHLCQRVMLTNYSKRIQSWNNYQTLLQTLTTLLNSTAKISHLGQGHLSHLNPAEWAVRCGGQNKCPAQLVCFRFQAKFSLVFRHAKVKADLCAGWKVVTHPNKETIKEETGQKVRKWLLSKHSFCYHKPFLTGATYTIQSTVGTTEQSEDSCKCCFS